MNTPINSKIMWAAGLSTIFIGVVNLGALYGYYTQAVALEVISIGVVVINGAIKVFRKYFTGPKP